ncbi:hypothetical protein EH222_14480, partial [candidate division KSB1 bacterium]
MIRIGSCHIGGQRAEEMIADLGVKDIAMLKDFPQDKLLGVGAIDVQSHQLETAEEVAGTLLRIAEYVPANRLWVNPDCGLNHLPRKIAAAKLKAMVAG